MKHVQIFRRDGDDERRERNPNRGDKGGRGPQLSPAPGRPFRNMAFWALLLLLALVAYRMWAGNLLTTQRIDIPYTRFVQELERGNIDRATFVEETRTVLGELRQEASETVAGRQVMVKAFKTNFLGDGALLAEKTRAANPNAQIAVQAPGINWLSVLFTWLPLLLFLVAWMFMLRQMQSGGSAAMRFGKSKARVLMESQTRVTFKDVAGCDEAKQELQEVIEFLKEPQKFQRLGGRIPKGALLLGPPGSGKTLLAKAVAGEAGVPFFSMSGSDFVEMFVGVGASVTGDTPVLVRHEGRTRLVPIGEFVDGFYSGDAAGFPVRVEGVRTLGFEKRTSASGNSFVEGSAWKSVAAVYRHPAHEIFEVRYQGGVLRATGDHSVFIHSPRGVQAKEARALEPGDVLVELPFLAEREGRESAGNFAGSEGVSAQTALRIAVSPALRVGDMGLVTQAVRPAPSVGMGLSGSLASGAHRPAATIASASGRPVSLADEVLISPELMKLFGYFAASGLAGPELEFKVKNAHGDLQSELLELLRAVFGIKAWIEAGRDGSVRVRTGSEVLFGFFHQECGSPGPSAHVPDSLWNLPRRHFESYLTGYALGASWADPDSTKREEAPAAELLRELTWLASMHGLTLPGRTERPNGPVVLSVTSKRFEGYVYDLCGCGNQAFFGGEKPVLLHNSRVRDLFEQGKRNAPCLTGDTMITLSGGRELSIRDMFESQLTGVKVPSMSEDFRIEDVTVIGITQRPAPTLFEIRTSTAAVKATGNHRFPVLRDGRLEWVRTDHLARGEHVATPRVIPTTPFAPYFTSLLATEDVLVHWPGTRPGIRRPRLHDHLSEVHRRHREGVTLSVGRGGYRSSRLKRFPLEVSEDLAYLCGLISADGSFRRRGDRAIQFVNTEPGLHDRVRDILQTEFDYTPRRHLNAKRFHNLLPQGRPPQSLRDCWTTFINNRLLCDALRALDACVLELPPFLIAAWLRGVFDGDGCVRSSTSSPQVIISAWLPANNRKIRSALLRMGISVARSPLAHLGDDGNIVVTGALAIRDFIHKIYSDHPTKRVALDALASELRGRRSSSSRLDAVPVGGVLRAARESLGMGQRAFDRGPVVSAYERGLNQPSRTSLVGVVEEMDEWRQAKGLQCTLELEAVNHLAQSAVLWSRIESVTPIAAGEPVYDLCLDRNHNFIANNIFTENCIVFIDEIDAVGRHRGAGLGGGHDEREQTLNQLLVEMDGFESNEGVIIVAATNRPDVLDPALLRPGRFDRQIVVDWPDVRGREGILKVHTRKIPLSEDVDLKLIARETPGMAGADLANIVNEAALLAARRNKKKVGMVDFSDAKDKVTLGLERRSLVMTEAERKTTAYHEAGHALVAWLLPGSDPVTKITIIPRGRALGVTAYAPAEERHNHSKKQLEDRLCHAMGGRAAELLVFNHLTTGAANDLEQSTAIARSMVTRFGMSDKLGPLTFGKREDMIFLGKEITSSKDYSEQTAMLIDGEVRGIIERAHEMAIRLLRENMDKLHLLANALLERETIDGDQMDRLLRGEKLEPLPRPASPADTPPTAAAPATSAEDLGPAGGFGEPSPRPA